MLTDSEIELMRSDLEKIAIAQDQTFEQIVEMYRTSVSVIEATLSAADKPRKVILGRAKSQLDTQFSNSNKKGDNYDFLIFGVVGEAKDWNAGEIAAIEAELERGNWKGLVAEGKLFAVNGLPIAKKGKTTKVTKWIANGALSDVLVEGGIKVEEEIPLEEGAVFWKKDENKPLYRDPRLYVNNEPNDRGYSKEMRHAWSLLVVGIAWPTGKFDDYKFFECPIKYEQADITSDKYFFNKYETFVTYKAQFEIDDKNTKPWRYAFKTSSLTPVASTMVLPDLDYKLEEMVDKLHAKYEAEALAAGDPLPEFLTDVDAIPIYHNLCIKKNPDGSPMKGKTGWDSTYFKKYGILASNVSGMTEKSGNTNASYWIGGAGNNKSIKAWSKGVIDKQPRKIPGRCLIMIKTSRGTTRYDPATKTKINDPEHADIKVDVYSIVNVDEGKEDLSKVQIKGI
jgi:hypothetical protein